MVTREGNQLCAVTRSTCQRADCPRQKMGIILWGAYKNRRQNKYDDSDKGNFKYYAGRVRVPYDPKLCYQVEGWVGGENHSTLAINSNCLNDKR